MAEEKKEKAEKKEQKAPDLTLAAIKAAADRAAEEALRKGRETEDKKKKDDGREAKRAAEDARINDMTRAEFANMMFDRITEHLADAVKNTFTRMTTAMEERLKPLDGILVEKRVSEVKSKPDFEEFREDIASKLQARPDLTPLEAYHLVKAENPDKVKELSDKAAADLKEKEEKAPKKPTSFFPTNGLAIEGKTEKMTPTEAADAAWQAAMADVPASLYSGEQV